MQLTKYEQDLLLCANYAIATVHARDFCKAAQKWISRYGSARQRSEGYKWLDRIQLRIYDGAMEPFHEVNKQYGKENV